MKWLYRHLYKEEKGFTLVELMIVIIIIAILTGIAVPSYLVLRNRARVSAARAELMNIATAISIYEADVEAYPATGLAALTLALEADPVYMDPVPQADDWGIAYVYLSDGETYTLASGGVNKAVTTTISTPADDDIVIIDGQLQQ